MEKKNFKSQENIEASKETSQELSRERAQQSKEALKANEKLAEEKDTQKIEEVQEKLKKIEAEGEKEAKGGRRSKIGEQKKVHYVSHNRFTRSLVSFYQRPRVAKTAKVVEKSIGRPSVISGAIIFALVFGIGFQVFTYYYGFIISGWGFLIGLILGGAIGYLAEKVYRLFKPKTKNT